MHATFYWGLTIHCPSIDLIRIKCLCLYSWWNQTEGSSRSQRKFRSEKMESTNLYKCIIAKCNRLSVENIIIRKSICRFDFTILNNFSFILCPIVFSRRSWAPSTTRTSWIRLYPSSCSCLKMVRVFNCYRALFHNFTIIHPAQLFVLAELVIVIVVHNYKYKTNKQTNRLLIVFGILQPASPLGF